MQSDTPSRHPAAAHPETGGALDRLRPHGEGTPGSANGPALVLTTQRAGRSFHTKQVVHQFWRERMRDAPSVDHALACIMSGLELDRATTGGAS